MTGGPTNLNHFRCAALYARFSSMSIRIWKNEDLEVSTVDLDFRTKRDYNAHRVRTAIKRGRHKGGVLAQGAPDALLANPDVRRVYLGETFRL